MAEKTHPNEVGIAMMGATGSGKSTYLAALDHALIEKNCGWQVFAREPGSRKLLHELSTALMSRREFPKPTAGIDRFEWRLANEVSRTVRRGRFGNETITEPLEIPLNVTDASGELARPDQFGLADREALVQHLNRSNGILYMFDPIRESTNGDAYEKTNGLIQDLRAAAKEGFGGRLPHHLAVCLTKLDEPRIFATARELDLLIDDDQNRWKFPRVLDTDARILFDKLCEVGPDGNGEALPSLLEQTFYPHRIRFYVTSAVGFMLNERTRKFDSQDTENVYRLASGKSVVRSPVHPINVVEPVLWLVKQLALGA